MLTFDERPFRGIDASREPSDLSEGFLSLADNLIVEGGQLVTRPGKQGQLTAALGASVFELTPFLMPDGSHSSVFVAGGKLYKWVKGATSATELMQSGASVNPALVSANSFIAAAHGYAYVVDGSGPLRRTDLTTASVVAGLTTPTTPTVAKSSFPLLSNVGTINWFQDAFAGTGVGLNAITGFGGDIDFQTAWWTLGGGAVNDTYIGWSGQNCVELDELGEYADSGVLVLPANGAGAYGRFLEVLFDVAGEQTNSTAETQRVLVTITPYSDVAATTAIAGGQQSVSSVLVGDGDLTAPKRDRALFDLRGLTTTPRAVRIRFEQPDAQTSNRGTDVANVYATFPSQSFTLRTVVGGLAVGQGSHPVDGGLLLCAGAKITHTLGAATDFSKRQKILVALRPGSNVAGGTDGLTIRLVFTVTGGTTYTSDLLQWLPSGVEGLVDISLIASNLASVTKIGIEIVDDIPFTDLAAGGSSLLFTLGDVSDIGNLPIDYAPVFYRIAEFDSDPDPVALNNIVWSDGSPASLEIQPDERGAVGLVVVPALVNATADYFAVFRFGGSIVDNRGRLLGVLSRTQATFALGADAAEGSFAANPYLAWNSATRVLTDNTPDSWLISAPVYIDGREPAPGAPETICEWQGRLWISVGSELYGSWLLDANLSAGLYWSRNNLPESLDPYARIRGFFARIGVAGGDKIQRLIPLGSVLVILTQTSIYLLTGRDQSTFEVRPYRGEFAVGLVARRAATTFDNRLWFLGPDGLYAFDGARIEPASRPLRRLLSPASLPDGTAIPAAVLSKSALVASGRRLLLIAPASSASAANDIAYVYDEPTGFWTRWLSMNATGGASFNAATDTDDLFLAGIDGQIYRVGGQGDRLTAASGALAIPIEIRTRQFGDGAAKLQPAQLFVDVGAGAAGSLTLTVTGDTPGAAVSLAQAFPIGDRAWWMRISRSASGRRLSIGLTASSVSPIRIRRLALQAREQLLSR